MSEMKKTIRNIIHTFNLIDIAISRQGEEGEWEMEEVGSKLHLFGCQQKDLEKFHKVEVRWTLVMVIILFCYQNVDNIQGHTTTLTTRPQVP